jgi:hypothetical protein
LVSLKPLMMTKRMIETLVKLSDLGVIHFFTE